MRPHNDNNVYILGAGFSAEAGLPVISSFLARMRDAVDWLDKAGRATEREAIERVLDFRHESGAAGYRINIDLDNIEHLFSLADAKPGTASSDDIRLAIAATIDFAAQTGRAPVGRIRVSQSNGWPCTAAWRSAAVRWNASGPPDFSDVESSIYDYYAATLSGLTAAKRECGKNVVITLNYDVVVEEALRRLDIPISYQLSGSGVEFDPAAGIDESRAEVLQVLKLHGSVNWGHKPDGSVLVCHDYERVRMLALAPLLVPPTWQKIAAEALLRVWDAAVNAIAKATRIVLIGFSIPPADQHFKYLLSVGLKGNSSLRMVRIVDPRASALSAQYEAVFREDQFKYGIASIREQRTADFLYDRGELVALGRPLAHPGLQLVADHRGQIIERR
jgi:hypothetical protein